MCKEKQNKSFYHHWQQQSMSVAATTPCTECRGPRFSNVCKRKKKNKNKKNDKSERAGKNYQFFLALPWTTDTRALTAGDMSFGMGGPRWWTHYRAWLFWYTVPRFTNPVTAGLPITTHRPSSCHQRGT